MTRILLALAIIAALVAGGSAPASADSGPWLTNDTSLCGSLIITATGLQPNTIYQLVADGGYPDVVHTVTSNAYGSASTTVLRSEASSDSSADWGNTWVRTQYGGYLASNVVNGVAHPPAYHFCR